MSKDYKLQCPHCQSFMLANGDSSKAMMAMPSFNENAFVTHCDDEHKANRMAMRRLFRAKKAAGIPSDA